MLEKVIKNKLVSFLEKQKIFYDYQYGFRKKRGVLHTLLDVITPGYDASRSRNCINAKITIKEEFLFALQIN